MLRLERLRTSNGNVTRVFIRNVGIQRLLAAWPFGMSRSEKPNCARANCGRERGDHDADAALRSASIAEFHEMITSRHVARHNCLRTERCCFDRNSVDPGVPSGEPELGQLGFACC